MGPFRTWAPWQCSPKGGNSKPQCSGDPVHVSLRLIKTPAPGAVVYANGCYSSFTLLTFHISTQSVSLLCFSAHSLPGWHFFFLVTWFQQTSFEFPQNFTLLCSCLFLSCLGLLFSLIHHNCCAKAPKPQSIVSPSTQLSLQGCFFHIHKKGLYIDLQ